MQPQTPAVPLPPHDWPVPVHWVQVPPPVPQASLSLMRQVPALSQQPLGQLVPSQTHCPLWQRCPVAHAIHVPPLRPHALVLFPSRHVLPSQQPLPPHGGEEHVPLSWHVAQPQLEASQRQVPSGWQTWPVSPHPSPTVRVSGSQAPVALLQVWQIGQVALQLQAPQLTGVPQVFVTVPQRSAQVRAGDSREHAGGHGPSLSP